MSNCFYQKLLESEPLGFIDPFTDLGDFDSVQMKFKEPVSHLINKYSGYPYSLSWQKKIEEMRSLYILYQKSLQNEDVKLELHSRVRSQKKKDHVNEIVTTYLSLGFRFLEIESKVSLTNTRLRRNWSRSQFVKTAEPQFYFKKDLKAGFAEPSSILPKSLKINLD